MNQNGHLNGTSRSYVSSSYNNLQPPRDPSISFYVKLKRITREFYNLVRYQINNCIQKCSSLMQSVASWSRQSLTQREELSCSYMPSRRNREDLIDSYENEFPSMSEDVTDFESSRLMEDKNESLDDLDNLTERARF